MWDKNKSRKTYRQGERENKGKRRTKQSQKGEGVAGFKKRNEIGRERREER